MRLRSEPGLWRQDAGREASELQDNLQRNESVSEVGEPQLSSNFPAVATPVSEPEEKGQVEHASSQQAKTDQDQDH
ncbi:hypothetical protein GCM10009107_44180 [Ideonella azotifigens]|uniref:Uncharacterized protein n=1 Tax=Ideonella azotifigens TaxID=513160 RepID=A0ABN1KB40_9BURK